MGKKKQTAVSPASLLHMQAGLQKFIQKPARSVADPLAARRKDASPRMEYGGDNSVPAKSDDEGTSGKDERGPNLISAESKSPWMDLGQGSFLGYWPRALDKELHAELFQRFRDSVTWEQRDVRIFGRRSG